MCFHRHVCTCLAEFSDKNRKWHCLKGIPEYFCCGSSVVQAQSPVHVKSYRRCSVEGVPAAGFLFILHTTSNVI